MRWPGHIAAGRVSDALVSLVDILPTLLAAATRGAEQEARDAAHARPALDGLDLSPLLFGVSAAASDEGGGGGLASEVRPGAAAGRSVLAAWHGQRAVGSLRWNHLGEAEARVAARRSRVSR